jgi:hypothetical protein
VLIIFLFLWQNTWKSQLKGKKLCFGSWLQRFQSTVIWHSLLHSCHEVSNCALPYALCHDVLSHHRTRRNEPSNLRLKHLKLWAKRNFPPISWCSQVFCCSNGKMKDRRNPKHVKNATSLQADFVS